MKRNVGSNPTTTIEPGGLGLCRDTKRLIDPTAGKSHAIGNRVDDIGHGAGAHDSVRLPAFRSRYCCSIQA